MYRILIDTREQNDYSFSVPVVRRKLEAGDYSVEGLETRVAVERKSLSDFVSTVIHARKRFHAELRKLADYEFACVERKPDASSEAREGKRNYRG